MTGRRSVLDTAVSTFGSAQRARRHPRPQHRHTAVGCLTRTTSANTNSNQDKGTSRAADAFYFSRAGGGARPWLVSPSAQQQALPRVHGYSTATPPDDGGGGGGGSGGSSALRDPATGRRDREEEPFEKLGRGLHSFASQPNLSDVYGTGRGRRGRVGRIRSCYGV
jgi:hypothetical protein